MCRLDVTPPLCRSDRVLDLFHLRQAGQFSVPQETAVTVLADDDTRRSGRAFELLHGNMNAFRKSLLQVETATADCDNQVFLLGNGLRPGLAVSPAWAEDALTAWTRALGALTLDASAAAEQCVDQIRRIRKQQTQEKNLHVCPR